ncbi:branched-chain amino acid transporter permease [Leadbettera azotonutricia]|uniref:Branched-chain amino acid transport n=1 Tax=Leadbettera azotonutricia (strain ATCC BAA-888 / DSM 13862 / ZAS-9) TaxID=545695 RepID=F5YFJ8_LEAAZ|nr:AzlD domain-containing protein [Leadbettera azotonutricia]AEF81893.1 branched-chain amino acid transport [Leadbettera azotonutricia ZAS-9]
MNTLGEALVFTFATGAVVLFCRAFPFIFFRTGNGEGNRGAGWISFVEKIVPPAAMTVLAVSSVASSIKANVYESLPVLAAAGVTAALHLWKRNSLISIFGGTALYMVLKQVLKGF